MKRVIPLLSVLAVLALAFFFLTQDVESSYSRPVQLPAIKAMTYFSDTLKLRQWMVPFQQESVFGQDRLLRGQDTLTIVKLAAFRTDFRRSSPEGTLDFNISVIPDKDSVFRSLFLLNYNLPRWKQIFGNSLANDARASIDSLQAFLGNPEKLYGFAIQNEPVTDTSFLFAKKTIAKKDFAAETKALFDMLIAEANQRGAGYNGVRIFHFIDNGDQRTIFASVGIRKDIETKEGDIVSLKKMPFQMNLLTIDYKGLYKDLPKAYQALEDYRSDFRFVTMAIPFHKYLDEGYGFADSSMVHMKVTYPVY